MKLFKRIKRRWNKFLERLAKANEKHYHGHSLSNNDLRRY